MRRSKTYAAVIKKMQSALNYQRYPRGRTDELGEDGKIFTQQKSPLYIVSFKKISILYLSIPKHAVYLRVAVRFTDRASLTLALLGISDKRPASQSPAFLRT